MLARLAITILALVTGAFQVVDGIHVLVLARIIEPTRQLDSLRVLRTGHVAGSSASVNQHSTQRGPVPGPLGMSFTFYS